MLRYNFNNASALCARQFSGSYGVARYLFSRTELRNISAGEGITSGKVGIPYGHLFPSSWSLPTQTGALSSYEDVRVEITGSLIRGTNIPAQGNTTISITSTGTLTGRGRMIGSSTTATELSPENLAAAVWNSDITTYNVDGTMGKQLNKAKTNTDLIPALV